MNILTSYHPSYHLYFFFHVQIPSLGSISEIFPSDEALPTVCANANEEATFTNLKVMKLLDNQQMCSVDQGQDNVVDIARLYLINFVFFSQIKARLVQGWEKVNKTPNPQGLSGLLI